MAASLLGWCALAALSHRPPVGMVWWLLGILAGQWALALVAWRMAFGPRVAVARSLVLAGVAFRLVGWAAEPVLEDDHHRFLWDGRMFALTGNPYGSAPMDHFSDTEVPERFAEILDRINHPDIPTIYGPVAEFGFLAAYLAAPGRLWPWRAILLGADLLLIAGLIRLSRTGGAVDALGVPPAAVLAAWCPLGIFETAFNAHPEVLAVALVVAAAAVRQAGGERRWAGVMSGALMGLAVAARVPAILAVPFVLWRTRPAVWVAFVVALAACHAPFWLQGSLADLRVLLAFGSSWEFNSSVHALLAWSLGPDGGRMAGVLLFGVAWLLLLVGFVRGPRSVERGALALTIVYGAFFLLSPVFNPWYALWLLPFVALRPTVSGVTMMAVVGISYLTRQNLGDGGTGGYDHPVWVRPVEFGLIAVAVAVDFALRHGITLSARRGACGDLPPARAHAGTHHPVGRDEHE